MFHCYCYPDRSPAPTRTKGGVTGGPNTKGIGLDLHGLLACLRPWEYTRGFWRSASLDELGCSAGSVDTVGVRGGDFLENMLEGGRVETWDGGGGVFRGMMDGFDMVPGAFVLL